MHIGIEMRTIVLHNFELHLNRLCIDYVTIFSKKFDEISSLENHKSYHAIARSSGKYISSHTRSISSRLLNERDLSLRPTCKKVSEVLNASQYFLLSLFSLNNYWVTIWRYYFHVIIIICNLYGGIHLNSHRNTILTSSKWERTYPCNVLTKLFNIAQSETNRLREKEG